MRVLFDQNVPKKARRFLPGHEVRTAADMNWSGLEDGPLLAMAVRHNFDVIVTADQSIPSQQNLTKYAVALVVLSTNNWPIIKNAADRLSAAVNAAKWKSFQKVEY